jgi:hypothetical protein
MMTWWALILGSLLFVVGPIGYIGSGYASKTALIPSIFGLLLGLFGWMSGSQGAFRLPWWIAGVVVASLGVFGSYKGIHALVLWIQNGSTAKPLAVVSRTAMTLVCSAFLLLSFLQWWQRGQS